MAKSISTGGLTAGLRCQGLLMRSGPAVPSRRLGVSGSPRCLETPTPGPRLTSCLDAMAPVSEMGALRTRLQTDLLSTKLASDDDGYDDHIMGKYDV